MRSQNSLPSAQVLLGAQCQNSGRTVREKDKPEEMREKRVAIGEQGEGESGEREERTGER